MGDNYPAIYDTWVVLPKALLFQQRHTIHAINLSSHQIPGQKHEVGLEHTRARRHDGWYRQISVVITARQNLSEARSESCSVDFQRWGFSAAFTVSGYLVHMSTRNFTHMPLNHKPSPGHQWCGLLLSSGAAVAIRCRSALWCWVRLCSDKPSHSIGSGNVWKVKATGPGLPNRVLIGV